MSNSARLFISNIFLKEQPFENVYFIYILREREREREREQEWSRERDTHTQNAKQALH